MSYQMSFATLVHYDTGQPSIMVAVTLSLSQDQINWALVPFRVTSPSFCIYATF
jgi:hypothetical protein